MASSKEAPPNITIENTPDAEQQFLRNLDKEVGLRMLAKLMADGMDPDAAYDAVLAMEGKKKDA